MRDFASLPGAQRALVAVRLFVECDWPGTVLIFPPEVSLARLGFAKDHDIDNIVFEVFSRLHRHRSPVDESSSPDQSGDVIRRGSQIFPLERMFDLVAHAVTASQDNALAQVNWHFDRKTNALTPGALKHRTVGDEYLELYPEGIPMCSEDDARKIANTCPVSPAHFGMFYSIILASTYGFRGGTAPVGAGERDEVEVVHTWVAFFLIWDLLGPGNGTLVGKAARTDPRTLVEYGALLQRLLSTSEDNELGSEAAERARTNVAKRHENNNFSAAKKLLPAFLAKNAKAPTGVRAYTKFLQEKMKRPDGDYTLVEDTGLSHETYKRWVRDALVGKK